MKTTEKSVPVGWGGGTLLGEGRLPVGFPANSTVDQVQFKVVAPSDTGRERKEGEFFSMPKKYYSNISSCFCCCSLLTVPYSYGLSVSASHTQTHTHSEGIFVNYNYLRQNSEVLC